MLFGENSNENQESAVDVENKKCENTKKGKREEREVKRKRNVGAKLLKGNNRTAVKKQERKFECLSCKKLFRNQKSLMVHKKIHTDAKGYNCEVCGKLYKTRFTLKTHFNGVHGNNPSVPCPTCGKCFKSKYNMELHASKHSGIKKFPCPLCGKLFSEKVCVKRHLVLHTGVKAFQCVFCPKTFYTKGSLQTHGRTHLDSGARHSCPVCFKQFKRESYLPQHLLLHRNEPQFYCSQCEYKTHWRHSMAKHALVHIPDYKPHACLLCPKRFKQLRSFKHHILVHRGEKPLKCDVCDKRFVRALSLKRHEVTHTNVKKYVCQTCSTAFADPSALIAHKKVHAPPLYDCTICGKSFRLKHYLNVHLTKHKALGSKFNCLRCPSLKVTSRSQLLRHMTAKHPKAKHECLICKRLFTSSEELHKHETTHTTEKVFTCALCKFEVSGAINFENHARKHLKLPPRLTNNP